MSHAWGNIARSVMSLGFEEELGSNVASTINLGT